MGKTEEGTSSRIFVITDMEVEKNDGDNFVNFVSKNFDESVWTTVIGIIFPAKFSRQNFNFNLGVGLDLSADVIERVSKTAGANYSNVR